MRFVVISGNIGAGKTTAGRLAALAVDACFVEEPVKLWQESGALEMAYSGMVNAFQPFALASRIFLMKKRIAEYTRLKGKPPSSCSSIAGCGTTLRLPRFASRGKTLSTTPRITPRWWRWSGGR